MQSDVSAVSIEIVGDKLTFWEEMKGRVVAVKMPGYYPEKGTKVGLEQDHLEVTFEETDDGKIYDNFYWWLTRIDLRDATTPGKKEFAILQEDISTASVRISLPGATIMSMFTKVYPVAMSWTKFTVGSVEKLGLTVRFHAELVQCTKQ